MRQITPYKINNAKTYISVLNQMVAIAENVFILDIPADNIFLPFVNEKLFYNGSIAFFVDPVMGLIALPYELRGRKDIYGRPNKIQCFAASTNYRSKVLDPDEYVIMYDNTLRLSIYPTVQLFASRMSATMRTSDININQQKTPRIFKCTTGSEITLKNMFKQIDANEDAIFPSKDFDLSDVQTVLAPAPFVADKVDTHADKIWNEFCRYIGIGNITESKRERLIRDEVNALQAGAIASRYSRYLTRAMAIDEINKKFGGYIEGTASVRYFDTEPGTDNPDGDIFTDESEVNDNEQTI